VQRAEAMKRARWPKGFRCPRCDDVVIGAGAVVTKYSTVTGTYAGNPAQLLRRLAPTAIRGT
jgi:hypothetical protein